jgi:O-antigen/teichoic acid export membrane protein
VISATAVATVAVALAGSMAILLLSNWLVISVFEIEPASQAKTIDALRISAVTISVFMIGQIAMAILQGLHRFDVFSAIQVLNSLVLMSGNWILAYNGYGLLALLYWNLGVTLLTCMVAFISAWRVLPEFGFSLDFGQETLRLIARYSAGVIGYQIAANAFFLFERGWITAKLGTAALTYYVVPMSLGIYFHGFVSSLALVIFPLASEFDHDRARLLRLYQAATKSILFVVVIGSTTLIALGKPFLILWLGNDFGENSSTLLSFQAVAFGLAAISIVSFQTAEGLGHPGFNFRNAAIGALLALPLIVGLTETLGNTGVVLGRVLVFLVPFLAIFDLERRYLGEIQTKFWIYNGLRFGLAAIVVYITETVASSALPVTWGALIFCGAIGCVAYLLCLLLSGGLAREDRNLVRKLLASEA